MADDQSKSGVTHYFLSRVIDLWMEGKSIPEKTDLMNFLIHQINWWLAWRYPPVTEQPQYDPRQVPIARPACLNGGAIDTRIWTAMLNDCHPTLWHMAQHSDSELLRAPNFGRKSLKRLRELQAAGLAEESSAGLAAFREEEQ